jgi:hypothetical protein
MSRPSSKASQSLPETLLALLAAAIIIVLTIFATPSRGESVVVATVLPTASAVDRPTNETPGAPARAPGYTWK